MNFRPFSASDHQAVYDLLDQAFAPSTYESLLVRRFHTHDKPRLEWVGVTDDEKVVAHVCFTRAFQDQHIIGWHMAPVAVLPQFQGQGFGSGLIRHSLQQEPLCREAVFVLGSPDYYRRFGFLSVSRPTCSFDEGNAHFLSLRDVSSGEFVVGYESEFMEEA